MARVAVVFLTLVALLMPSVRVCAETAQSNLDLASTERTVDASITQPATINVGGVDRTVNPGDFLTDAERIAVMQVLSTGTQSLLLGPGGNAAGGTVNLSQISSVGADLVIPNGVTALRDFAHSSVMDVLGNLTNSGKFYAYSTSSQVQDAVFNATNIVNNQAALFSTVLPVSVLSTLPGIVVNLGLTLNALNDIVNAGAITSGGNLNLNAGGSIINGSSAGVGGPSAVIQSVGSLSIDSANVTNAGLISSFTSNVNIGARIVSDLTLNNTGGVIEALTGAVNIRNELFAAKADTALLGGNILSRELNIFSGTGVVNAMLHDVTGRLNIHAGEAHVTAATSNLHLGDIVLVGDPTFYNVLGDVTISGAMSFNGEALAIVAKRNIVSAAGAGVISTATISGTDDAGDITMIAGAEFTTTGPASGSGDTTSVLAITGGSLTGGKIDLTQDGGITSFDAGSFGGEGGTVRLTAHGGINPDSGSIKLPTSVTLQTAGATKNGNVEIVVGMPQGEALSIGTIDTRGTGAAENGGNILISSAMPVLGDPDEAPVPIIIQNGQIFDNSFKPGRPLDGDLTLRTLTPAAGATVSIRTQGGLTLPRQEISVSGQNAGGEILLFARAISAVTGTQNTLSLNANATAGPAGKIFVQAFGSDSNLTLGGLAGNLQIFATSGNGDGGKVTVIAGRDLTVDTPFSTPFANLDVRAGVNGLGGDITLFAGFANQGRLIVSGSAGLESNGAGNGAGGNIVLVSNSSLAFNIGSGSSGVSRVRANGGPAGGDGGSITVINQGTGGVGFNPVSDLTTSVLVTDGNGGSININGAEEVDIGLEIPYAANGHGPTILGNGTLSANGIGVDKNAGSIAIGGDDIFLTTGFSFATLTLQTLATGTGSAGVIEISTNRNDSSFFVTSDRFAAPGNFIIRNRGDYSTRGSTTLRSAGFLGVMPSGLEVGPLSTTANGQGAVYELEGTFVSVLGSLSADGVGTGDGGSITIKTHAPPEAFIIGPTAFLNGVTGTISANSGFSGGAGGKIEIVNEGPMTINSPASLSVLARNGNGGSIILRAGSERSLPASQDHQFFGSTPQTLKFGTAGTLAANAAGNGSHSGGVIDISAGTIITPGTLTLSANGTADSLGNAGFGGTINVLASAAALTIGGKQLVISAHDGGGLLTSGGTGGSVRVIAGGNLTVVPASLSVQPLSSSNSAGGSIYLQAGLTGAGNLSISAPLSASASAGSASGKDAGTITLISNSTLPFVVGAAGANAINGTVTAAGTGSDGRGGAVQIVNTGSGGISLVSLDRISVTAQGGEGGFINLGADIVPVIDDTQTLHPSVFSGYGPVSLPGGVLDASAGAGGNKDGGIIAIAGKTIAVTGANLLLDVSGTGTGSGGGVSLLTTAGAITVGSGPGQIAIAATGGTRTPGELYRTKDDGGSGLLGQVDIQSGGDLQVNSSSMNLTHTGADMDGALITLAAGRFGTASLLVNGNLSVNGTGSGSGGSIVLTGGNCATCAIAVNGALSANGAGSGSGGNIFVEVLNNGPVIFTGGLSANGGSAGAGGTVRIGSSDAAAGVVFGPLLPTESGGTISFLLSGNAAVSANAAGSDQAGGSVILQGTRLLVSGGNLAFSANGIGDADAGTIDIVTSLGDISVGSQTGQIQVSTVGNGQGTFLETGFEPLNGIKVTSGGNIVADSSFILFGPAAGVSDGDGGNVSLQAGTSEEGGFLLISGGLNADGVGAGRGGAIILGSNARSPFTIAASGATHGVNGSVSVNAGTDGDAGALIIRNNGGGVDVLDASLLSIAAAGDGDGGVLVIDSAGTLSLAAGAYSVDASGNGTGGSLTVNAFDLDDPGSNVQFQANGSGTGSGGTVSIQSDGALEITSSFITLFADSGNSGGAGGVIEVDTEGNLTITGGTAVLSARPLGTDGTGGTYRLISGGLLSLDSGIDAGGAGAGHGGSITLVSDSATAFVIGAAGSNSVDGALSADGGPTAGNAGFITVINLGGGVTLDSLSDISVSATFGGGGGLTLTAFGAALTIPTGTISVSASGGDFNGGDISLSGSHLATTGLALSANASGVGFAGSISVVTTGGTSLADLGIGAAQRLTSLSATGAGAAFSDPNISVSSGRNLTVATSALSLGPQAIQANGGSLSLTAGTTGQGDLSISGSLSGAGNVAGHGGTIVLQSNSSSPFMIGGSGSNGITNATNPVISVAGGSQVGNAGSIQVINNGTGGVELVSSSNLTFTVVKGNGASLSLVSPEGTLTIPGGSYNVTGSEGFDAGALTLVGANLSFNSGGGFTALAGQSSRSRGSGGDVRLELTSGSVAINSSFVIDVRGGTQTGRTGNVDVIAANGLSVTTSSLLATTLGVDASGGNIYLESGDNLSIVGTLDVSGKGDGDGGTITLICNSLTTFNIGGGGPNGTSSSLIANSGSSSTGFDISSSNAGAITVRNNGTGGVRLSSLSSVSVAVRRGVNAPTEEGRFNGVFNIGAGGSLEFDGGSGPLILPGATIEQDGDRVGLNVDANSGIGAGGSIALFGETIAVDGPALPLSAFGDEGFISIVATGALGEITVGTSNGQFIINAENSNFAPFPVEALELPRGGRVVLSAGRNLIVNSSSLSINPLGTKAANGGNISLSAGTAGPGLLRINGDLRVDAIGTGTAGNITITYNSILPFVVGGKIGTTNSGVTGLISASSIQTVRYTTDFESQLGNQSGGTVMIGNSAFGAATQVVVNSTILADSPAAGHSVDSSREAYGSLGTIEFQGFSGAVTVTASSLTGVVRALALDGITLALTRVGATLTAGEIGSLGGQGQVLLKADSIDLRNATVYGQNITLLPNNGRLPVTLGGGSKGAGSTFDVLSHELNNLSASNSIFIGSSTLSPSMTVTRDVDLSDATGEGAIVLGTAGTFSSGNFSLAAGNRQLVIIAGTANIGDISGADVTINTSSGVFRISGTLSSSGSLNLSSTRGSLGTAASPLQVEVGGTLTASATSAVALSSDASLSIGLSRAGKGSFSVQSGGNITAMGDLIASIVNLTTTGNGDITIADNVSIGTTRGTTTLSAGGSGSIIRGGENSRILSSTVIASSETGDIDIRAAAANVSANTGGSGDVSIVNAFAKFNLGPSAAGNLFSLTNAGPVTTKTVEAATISIQSNGNLVLGGNVTAGTEVLLNAQGAGRISSGTVVVVTAPSIELTSGTGGIGLSKTPLMTVASTIAAETMGTGGAFLSNTGDLVLNGASIGGAFALTNNGSVTIADTLSAGPVTIATLNSGNISIAADVGRSTAPVTLSANGSGNISMSCCRIFGTVISLVSATGTIGSLQTRGSTVTARTGGNSVEIHNDFLGNITLPSSSSGGSFTLVNENGGITSTGILSAANIDLTTGNDGNLTVLSSMGAAGATVVLTAAGAGSVIFTGKAPIIGNSVTLASSTGNIGSTKGPVRTAAATVKATTGGGGLVSLANSGDVLLDGSAAGTSFRATSTGSMTVSDVTVTNGSLFLQSATQLVIGAGASLTAIEGDITLNSTNRITGTIFIGNGAEVSASATNIALGNVFIAVGSVPPAKTNPSPPAALPANVSANITGDGKIYLGTNSFSANGTSNQLNAFGREIIFSTGTLGAEAIELDGDVTIQSELLPIAYRPGASPPHGSPSAVPEDLLATLSDDSVAGDFLLLPESHVSLHVRGMRIEIARASAVYLSKGDDSVALYNLHDSKSGSVKFTYGNRQVRVAPGEVLVFSNRSSTFEKLSPLDNMTYRDVRKHASLEGASLYTAEFSLVNAMSRITALRRIRCSTDPAQLRVARSIIKTAAIIQSLRARAGAYRPAATP